MLLTAWKISHLCLIVTVLYIQPVQLALLNRVSFFMYKFQIAVFMVLISMKFTYKPVVSKVKIFYVTCSAVGLQLSRASDAI